MSSKLQPSRLQADVSGTATPAALALRSAMFRAGRGHDRDVHDDLGHHVNIREACTGELAACLRCHVHDPAEVGQGYTAQFYDLSALHRYPRPLVEVGRFCVAPKFALHPDVVRLAWSAVTQIVGDHHAGLLFGCTSIDPNLVRQPRTKEHPRWQVTPLGSGVLLAAHEIGDLTKGRLTLLDLYLRMGGWVTERAVRDPDLGTLHVFTALEVDAFPQGRARRLRGMAAPEGPPPNFARARLVDAPVVGL